MKIFLVENFLVLLNHFSGNSLEEKRFWRNFFLVEHFLVEILSDGIFFIVAKPFARRQFG